MKEHAILLVGELRLAKETQVLLNKLCNLYDVFVVTDRKYLSCVEYLGFPIDVLCVEDILGGEQHNKFYKSELGIPHALQMHKAYLGFERLKEMERYQGRKYKTVYKVRSDWDMDFPLDLEIFRKFDCQNQFIYMQSDMFYGGGRDIAEIWSHFYYHILAFYFDRLDEYWPFDCPDLNDCDLRFAGLERFPFPSGVVGTPTSKEELEEILKERWREIKNYNDKNISFYRLRTLEPKFPCEAAFLHFILKHGLKFKKINDTRIPLDPFRFYDDVEVICQKIRAGRYECAANEILQLSPEYKIDIPQNFVIKLRDRKFINQHGFDKLNYYLMPLLSNAGYKTNNLTS